MKNQVDLSIIIVNYNTSELLDACLHSIYSKKHRITYQVIVIDNGSTDESVELVKKKFSTTVLIQNPKNDGYAKANNIGLRRAVGRNLLLLNSDTEVFENTLDQMVGFVDKTSDCGAATCKILLPDNSIDPACHRGFPTPWVAFTYLSKLEKLFPKSKFFGEYHQGYKNFGVIHEVDSISGAFFLVKRQVLDKIGLLDEDYFMYGEDIDLAFRIKMSGWKIYFNPEVAILHKKKQSGRAHVDKRRKIKTEIYFHKYNWLFYKKNYEKKYGFIISVLINCIYSLRIFLLERFAI